MKVEEYANQLISPEVPIDELGLLVIARMYHTHFGVILNDRVWYTTDDNTSQYSKFHLMYQGGVYFSDTCTGNWNMPSPPPVLCIIDENKQEKAVNLKVPSITSKTNEESQSSPKMDSKDKPEKWSLMRKWIVEMMRTRIQNMK